ncbi:MAG: hypothetical protein M3O15_01090 [Acidobacteriota bacterium]|nr:hypothetical protein [Acidobacteriota bacterium]
MQKAKTERVLARVLSEELKLVQGNDGDVTVTQGPVRRDITQISHGDVPAQ